jgi:hypothetical protein
LAGSEDISAMRYLRRLCPNRVNRVDSRPL